MLREPSDSGRPSLRIRLDFGYDGTGFAGWARQPGLRTVQGELEAGLSKILRFTRGFETELRSSTRLGSTEPTTDGLATDGAVQVAVAGRTDAGVHARGQVAHLDVPASIWKDLPGRSDRVPEVALVTRLNAVLPDDIVINSATTVPGDFDARFSAASRRYMYRIADDPIIRDALNRHSVLNWNRHLDVNLMDQAARKLVGLHDFAAFCKPRPEATTIRRLLTYSWRRPNSGPDKGLVVATIRADAFCHHMVRALVGAALKVGEHKKPVEWPLELLNSNATHLDTPIVPAHGLTLEEVTYPPLQFAAERATKIRAKRTL